MYRRFDSLNSYFVISTIVLIFVIAITIYDNNIADAQLAIPDFKTKESSPNSSDKPSEEIAMKVQLEEDDNKFRDDWYQVSDFAFVTSNTSQLCPVGICEYELDEGEMSHEPQSGEGFLTGKFKIDTGESKKVMNMRADWETIEERELEDGKTIQIIEGMFGVGRNELNPEHEYKINGILTPDNDDYLLEARGTNSKSINKDIEKSSEDKLNTGDNCMILHDGSKYCA